LGVVGWIDLAATDAADQIQRRARDPLFLGLRPMLQDLDDPCWILQSSLTPVLDAVAAAGLVFDALILSHQIAAITELARRHPQLSIVLDHAAKPQLGGDMAGWMPEIERLAALPNVTCKASGLLTELRPGGSRSDIVHALGVLFDLFGPQRLLWGSDWPVLTLAASYRDWFELARGAIAGRDASAVSAGWAAIRCAFTVPPAISVPDLVGYPSRAWSTSLETSLVVRDCPGNSGDSAAGPVACAHFHRGPICPLLFPEPWSHVLG
jgi:L-fuconolactonase